MCYIRADLFHEICNGWKRDEFVQWRNRKKRHRKGINYIRDELKAMSNVDEEEE